MVNILSFTLQLKYLPGQINHVGKIIYTILNLIIWIILILHVLKSLWQYTSDKIIKNEDENQKDEYLFINLTWTEFPFENQHYQKSMSIITSPGRLKCIIMN
jgi:hypothetical protein